MQGRRDMGNQEPRPLRLTDIPIRLKLPFAIGMGLFLFAGVVMLYTLTLHHTITRYEYLMTHDMQIRQSALEITIQMLQARRAEKDFLLNKDITQLSKVNQSVELAIQAARTIEQLIQNNREYQEIANRLVLVEHLGQYKELLNEIVLLWQKKGLMHQEGEQGVFRQAAHLLEQAMPVMGSHEAMVGYLSMRRVEKDYLLRQEAEYVKEVEKLARELEKRLQESLLAREEKDRLGEKLTDYLTAFGNVVAMDQQLAAKMALLREIVHKVETLTNEIETLAVRGADASTSQTRQFAESAALWIFVGSSVTILASGWLAFFLIGSLLRSIGTLWRFAHDVVGGNLEATTTLSGRDEIGQLAQVLHEMVNRMRAIRLIADRLVMIMALIGRGAIPDEITVEFHGDFQKISNALNEMIERLRELRRISVRIERISQGEIPEKVTGEWHGDFKRIHDAMNTIIDKLEEIGGLPASSSGRELF